VKADLYVWAAPRDVDAQRAGQLLGDWEASGGDPATSPFEPSTDIGWFVRELLEDAPGLEVATDAIPTQTSTPIWLSSKDEPAARIAAIRLPQAPSIDRLDLVFSLAAKYDLTVYDAGDRRLHRPLDEFAEHASATFWPGGAVQAAVAGGAGAAIAVGAFLVGIPIVSGIAMLVGAFLFTGSVYTFVHEARAAARRRDDADPPLEQR
jgi:hypothetical protein